MLISMCVLHYFVFVSQAAGHQIFPQVSVTPKPGVIHRPQVQHIQDNVVTLSNVQAPANLSSQSHTTLGSQNTTSLIPATLAKQQNVSLQAMNRKGKPVCGWISYISVSTTFTSRSIF